MKFDVKIRQSESTISEAVERATKPYIADGYVERLEERIELQGKLIARILEVMVGDYSDQYSDADHAPKDFAEKLEYIFGVGETHITVRKAK